MQAAVIRSTSALESRIAGHDTVGHDGAARLTPHSTAAFIQVSRPVGQRKPHQRRATGQVRAPHGGISVCRARHLITLNHGHSWPIQTSDHHRLGHRHAVGRRPSRESSAGLIDAIAHQDQSSHGGRIDRVLDVCRCRGPGSVRRQRIAALQGHVMHRLFRHLHHPRRAHAPRIALVIGPQHHHVAARRRPTVETVWLIAHYRPIPKLPSAGAGLSANLCPEIHRIADRGVGVAGIEGHTQRAGDGARIVFIAADGRRIGPRLPVNVHAAGG